MFGGVLGAFVGAFTTVIPAAFIAFREEVITRRTRFELRKAQERAHILVGLAIAVANIDDFIDIIKAAPTPPLLAKLSSNRAAPAARARRGAPRCRRRAGAASLPVS